jgi:hypothetical protein
VVPLLLVLLPVQVLSQLWVQRLVLLPRLVVSLLAQVPPPLLVQ